MGIELLRATVGLIAEDNQFDSAIEWLENEVPAWDGKERIDGFFITHFSVADTAYGKAVGAYCWTALAARALAPGSQADMVPVLIGDQGEGKSTGVRAMFPATTYKKIALTATDDNLARRMRGCLGACVEELRGLSGRDHETIKSFITETEENWVPKFKEFATTYQRRCVIIGTTNEREFLGDSTGNRRWLPMTMLGAADVEGIKRDMLQLWAEARERYRAGGIEWQNAERLAREVLDQHMIGDDWAHKIEPWLDTPDEPDHSTPRQRNFITSFRSNMKCNTATLAVEALDGQAVRSAGD